VAPGEELARQLLRDRVALDEASKKALAEDAGLHLGADSSLFAVTNEIGSYEIRGLPDGEYEAEAVHGQLKSVTGKISVKGGKTITLNLTLS
jgi:hypothetical protein